MYVKVELHAEVLLYLRGLPEADRDDFLVRLRRVREAPIKRSTRHTDIEIRRHDLRRFEFGAGVARIAIFEFDRIENRIRVLRCRFLKPRKLLDDEAERHDDAGGRG